jgi:hypothetical protein
LLVEFGLQALESVRYPGLPALVEVSEEVVAPEADAAG